MKRHTESTRHCTRRPTDVKKDTQTGKSPADTPTGTGGETPSTEGDSVREKEGDVNGTTGHRRHRVTVGWSRPKVVIPEV